MKKNRAQKDILYITISSFILVALWIGFNLYHTYTTSTIEPELQTEINPIDSRFDTDTINQLKSRKTVTPVYQIDATSSAVLEQKPVNQATESATLEQ